MTLWFEVTASTPPADVEAVCDVMRAVSPAGIAVEEPVDILGPELGFRVRPGEPVLIRAYLPGSELGAVLTDDLRRAIAAFPLVELTARPIYDEDWSTTWREFFGVVECGGRIVVVPTWVEHMPRPGQLAIRLDPGQAFGTGHHETTRLCLRALEDHVAAGASVLDVGTGSGILAIAAARLGATRVLALDIDPIAVEVASANVAQNVARGLVEARCGSLEVDHGASYGVVVANINPAAIIALAPALRRVVRAGGAVIVSGILGTDVARVRPALEREGLTLRAARHEHDWCCLEFGVPATSG